jgi:periplasmic copper chaperone A
MALSEKTSSTLIFFILLTSLFLPGFAYADNSLRISQISMPKLPPVSRTAAVYLTLENRGEQNVILTDVTTSVAHHAMIHQTVEVDGLVKMQHQAQLEIPAGERLVFQPGSYHIMLMGLDKNQIDKPFDVTLNFKHRAAITFTVNP